MNKITQSLDLRQSQNLVMTPQLQQAIKLLQLSNIELSEFIEEELAQNPLLEKDESNPDGASDEAKVETPEKDDMAEVFDSSYEDTAAPYDFDAGTLQASSGGNLKFDDPDFSLENRMASETTLRDHLQAQLFMASDDPRDRMIGSLLIDQLDESGYLRSDPKELAQTLGCAQDRMERLLSMMKGFDPTGIFAANLSECLALQLDEKGTLDAPMQKLLNNLQLLASFEHKKLADLCGVNETYLADMIAEIRQCNPKPAFDFDHLVVQTAIPDVLMKALPKNLGGGWRVELNTDTLPRVLINQDYYAEVKIAAKDKASKEYITSQMNNASWLVKAMDQRAKTILKVASAIVEEQDAFFNYGIEYLKPLKLLDIAQEIEMHESTVSRVTTNKYIGTPRGIFELKFFFSTALGGAKGSMAHSAEAVKARIKTMIDNENADDILSDDTIVEKLKEDGIDIARRTVAKYREALHIGSSVQRRREKKRLMR
jgi:RNA polymerase sigma-54 factor